jgi:hypothetical protein
MSYANLEVRQEIAKKRLKHYEVAQSLGISPYTLSVWLRTELSAEQKKKILKAIHDYKY